MAVIVVFLAIIKILFAVNPIQPFVNVCLWDIFSCDDLANSFTPLKHVHLLGAANTASKREDTTFTRVSIRRRVGDTERAVNAMAIFNNWALTAIVAALAHVMSAKAAVESYSAAVHAFPVNLGPAVDLAISLTGSHFFKDAGLAEKIFLLGITLLCILLLTIDKATKVWLLATVALVERAAAVGEFLRLAEIDVIRSDESLIIKNALCLGVQEGLFLNSLFERDKRTKLTGDRLGQAHNIDLLFAARAAHEGESNSEGCPFVLEKLNNTVCVENMATRELGACFGTKLTSVANCAQLILVDILKVTGSFCAVSMETRKAVSFVGNAPASVATLMDLVAEGNSWLLLNNGVLVQRINQNKLNFLLLKCGKLEASTDWRVGDTTFECWETSLKHRHLLFFIAVVRSFTH